MSESPRLTSVAQAIQRTDLAWMRSALAFVAVGAAMVKGLSTFGGPKFADGIAVLILAGAVILMAGGYILTRRSNQVATPRSLLLVSTGAVAVGLAAIVIGCTSP
jgi:uncharacterized membrane protein YidH (DUF202 family)